MEKEGGHFYMKVLAVACVMLGIIVVQVIRFFYPSWKELKEASFSDGKNRGFGWLGFGILLLMIILSQLILPI